MNQIVDQKVYIYEEKKSLYIGLGSSYIWYNYIYIYIYINRQNLEKIQLDSTIEIQFCLMCSKLFIFREFYFFNFRAKCGITS